MANNKSSWITLLTGSWVKFLLVGTAFVVWIVFFDKNSLLLQNKLQRELLELEEERTALISETKEYQEKLQNLKEDPARFAREKYYMHKRNELVFILD